MTNTPFRKTVFSRLIVLFWAATTVVACSGVPKGQLEVGQLTHDGLQMQKSDRDTQIQLKQQVDWSQYDKVMIERSQVAFRKNWDRDYNSDHISGRVREKDMDEIRAKVGEIVDASFSERLSQFSDLTLTEQPDKSTLLIKPNIINLDINAPDLDTTGINRSYAKSAGSLTIYLEVFDADSGEILARWIEDLEDREDMIFEWTNRVTNTADAKRVINSWVEKFAEGFDDLRTQNTTQ